jgi:hypothetical protein
MHVMDSRYTLPAVRRTAAYHDPYDHKSRESKTDEIVEAAKGAGRCYHETTRELKCGAVVRDSCPYNLLEARPRYSLLATGEERLDGAEGAFDKPHRRNTPHQPWIHVKIIARNSSRAASDELEIAHVGQRHCKPWDKQSSL